MIEERDKKINELLDIENSIYNLYMTIADCEINKNEKEKEKYIEYLKITIEVEAKIYDSLKIDTKNSGEIFRRINYINNKRKISQYDNIITRIETIIEEELYSNPFLSNSKSYSDQIFENSQCIKNEFNNNITMHIIKKLEDRIEKEKYNSIKEELITLKYELIYLNKTLEEHFLGYRKKDIYGRERCILFNQNEQLVNSIYAKALQDYLNESLNFVLYITDNQLKESIENKIDQIYQLIIIDSAIELLTETEKEGLYYSFYKNFLKGDIKNYLELYSSESLNEVKKIIKS